jgi:hypothetical protein
MALFVAKVRHNGEMQLTRGQCLKYPRSDVCRLHSDALSAMELRDRLLDSPRHPAVIVYSARKAAFGSAFAARAAGDALAARATTSMIAATKA